MFTPRGGHTGWQLQSAPGARPRRSRRRKRAGRDGRSGQRLQRRRMPLGPPPWRPKPVSAHQRSGPCARRCARGAAAGTVGLRSRRRQLRRARDGMGARGGCGGGCADGPRLAALRCGLSVRAAPLWCTAAAVCAYAAPTAAQIAPPHHAAARAAPRSPKLLLLPRRLRRHLHLA